MAEEFPPLPSQLFGSPAQNTLPYLSATKASQQGVALELCCCHVACSWHASQHVSMMLRCPEKTCLG